MAKDLRILSKVVGCGGGKQLQQGKQHISGWNISLEADV